MKRVLLASSASAAKPVSRDGVVHACYKAKGKGAKKPRKASSGQKEMLMPIAGKKASKEAAAKKPAARAHRKSA